MSRSASRCRTTSSTNPSLQLTSGNICCCCDICSVKKFAENRLGGFPKLIAVSFCLSICARRTQLSSCSPDMLSTSAIFIALPPLAILILSDHFWSFDDVRPRISVRRINKFSLLYPYTSNSPICEQMDCVELFCSIIKGDFPGAKLLDMSLLFE